MDPWSVSFTKFLRYSSSWWKQWHWKGVPQCLLSQPRKPFGSNHGLVFFQGIWISYYKTIEMQFKGKSSHNVMNIADFVLLLLKISLAKNTSKNPKIQRHKACADWMTAFQCPGGRSTYILFPGSTSELVTVGKSLPWQTYHDLLVLIFFLH